MKPEHLICKAKDFSNREYVGYILKNDDRFLIKENDYYIEIDPETIRQITPKKDKNKNPIFEDDLVLAQMSRNYKMKCKVIFRNGWIIKSLEEKYMEWTLNHFRPRELERIK